MFIYKMPNKVIVFQIIYRFIYTVLSKICAIIIVFKKYMYNKSAYNFIFK